jgi:hypothetical protein
VEKKKYDLCLEVLRRMKKEGILDKIMLVGSWCIVLYEDYFKGKSILPIIRTRDLEFLFPVPLNLDRKTDLYDLLKDLGFVLDYKGEQGYIIFQRMFTLKKSTVRNYNLAIFKTLFAFQLVFFL